MYVKFIMVKKPYNRYKIHLWSIDVVTHKVLNILYWLTFILFTHVHAGERIKNLLLDFSSLFTVFYGEIIFYMLHQISSEYYEKALLSLIFHITRIKDELFSLYFSMERTSDGWLLNKSRTLIEVCSWDVIELEFCWRRGEATL